MGCLVFDLLVSLETETANVVDFSSIRFAAPVVDGNDALRPFSMAEILAALLLAAFLLVMVATLAALVAAAEAASSAALIASFSPLGVALSIACYRSRSFSAAAATKGSLWRLSSVTVTPILVYMKVW